MAPTPGSISNTKLYLSPKTPNSEPKKGEKGVGFSPKRPQGSH